ncbi:g11872 [Coccomyxa viridis]|uniref:G11872 protein n=1 Tax=Coccomyxa viridis TaxID=1274662 RepID=A0ABP1G8Y6_9CHLO
MVFPSRQQTCKVATNLGTQESFGLRLLQKEEPSLADEGSHMLCGGYSTVNGDEAYDEEISTLGNRVLWSAAGIVAWASFNGMEGDSILCMLQQATLTAYSLKGSLHTVPLPPHVTAMHPLPHGLMLSGSGSPCSVLTHPLEPLVPLQAEEGGSDLVPMQGERIVWSSMEVPYIATHNQHLGRTALWAVRDGRLARKSAAADASATPRTPAFLLRNMPSTPKSTSKR